MNKKSKKVLAALALLACGTIAELFLSATCQVDVTRGAGEKTAFCFAYFAARSGTLHRGDVCAPQKPRRSFFDLQRRPLFT